MSSPLISFFIILSIMVLAGILNYLFSFLQWYMAINSGIKISLNQLLIMRRKGMPVNTIMDNLIKARHFGVEVELEQLYEHHKKGGDIYNLIDGLVKAKKYGLEVTLERAQKADLQKIKISDAVEQIAEERGLKR
ncbi:MAG: flotillin-like FloA family protein [Bacteroidales bacterium]|nr:flotillin-like FloA family protein [Bacteroidales bacterium]